MSVLIKGIDMPISCRACHLKMNCEECEGLKCVCVPLHQQIGYLDDLLTDKRRDDCPLVHVPPHGRLGDLDKLVEKIDAIWDCNDMVFSPNDHCCNVPEDCKGCKWVETKNFIRKLITNAQTIIQAEKVTQKDGGKDNAE